MTGVTVASIAKGADRNAGRETFFVEGREPFKLAPRDPALYFVQCLRDEAHRFAIGTHRAKRKKEFAQNPLDEIAGIGPSRKRALLQAFGRPRRWPARVSPISKRRPAFPQPPRAWCSIISTTRDKARGYGARAKMPY